MDKRFLIYEGFEYDIEIIFKEIIEKFNFHIKGRSDSGVLFENKKVTLDFSYETVPITWITYKSTKRDILLNHIVRESKSHLKENLKDILGENFYVDRKVSLKKFSQFLVEHFSEELSEG